VCGYGQYAAQASYASGVTLAHLLVLAILFAASKVPAQRGLLAACALLLFVVNGTFIVRP